MIVKAIWEFDVDDSDMDEESVDINKLCMDLAKIELDFCLHNNEVSAEDFAYEVHPELPSDFKRHKIINAAQLKSGNVFKYNDKAWLCKSNNGFMLSAENLDENDPETSFSWVGSINKHEVELITN